MAKVHPNSVPAIAHRSGCAAAASPPPTVLTVWRKSLLFNCDGFTVFDAKGDLAFRVDCYGSPGRRRRRAEVVLMDVAGKPLLTVRRKRILGVADHWLIYDGDDDKRPPMLSVRRHVSLRSSSSGGGKKALAHVAPVGSSTSVEVEASSSYVVEGSYGQRACCVRDAGNGDAVAEVRRKESLSVAGDVFRLVVADPRRMAAPLAMGLVIALDEMFSSSSSSGSARSLLRRTWSA
ncbi:hypothetical protein PR202_gb16571 [Eleusine coracana subsp. coracana]|uniref:Protein LURP-one-related 8 n=1 Tax=Eleusine coracana subsp. coracana TaxID=191504 RepID=A0AAV5F0T0_ELECO|nr:hypothetical protein PR202_gb16571 [Eleusine coracana subsp. coracana]